MYSIWSAIIRCRQLVKLELSMPYENCDGDYGNDSSALLDQDCLLDLPRSLSVAILSIPFKPKMDFDNGSWCVASLAGFSSQHLQSLVLTTGILWQNNAKVNLSRCLGLADPAIQCIFHDHDPRDQASLFSAVLVRQSQPFRTLAPTANIRYRIVKLCLMPCVEPGRCVCECFLKSMRLIPLPSHQGIPPWIS